MADLVPDPGFDYSTIADPELVGKLKSLEVEMQRVTREYEIPAKLAYGEILSRAHKELCAAGREGKFSSWVQAQWWFTRQTAYRYMSAHKLFGNCNSAVTTNLQPTAMYVLAESDVPKTAVNEAIKVAKKGKVTEKIAKQIIEKHTHKPQVDRSPPPPDVPQDERGEEHEPTDADHAADESEEISISDLALPYHEAVGELNKIRRVFDGLAKTESTGGHLKFIMTELRSLLHDAKRNIGQHAPVAWCTCEAGCDACHNTGFVTKGQERKAG